MKSLKLQKLVDAAIGNIGGVEITEVVKQGSIFRPTMYCSTAAKVNDMGEKVD